jgi:uncharacterized membrane protein
MRRALPTLSILQIRLIAYGVVGLLFAILLWQLYRDIITIVIFVNDKIMPYYRTLITPVK